MTLAVKTPAWKSILSILSCQRIRLPVFIHAYIFYSLSYISPLSPLYIYLLPSFHYSPPSKALTYSCDLFSPQIFPLFILYVLQHFIPFTVVTPPHLFTISSSLPYTTLPLHILHSFPPCFHSLLLSSPSHHSYTRPSCILPFLPSLLSFLPSLHTERLRSLRDTTRYVTSRRRSHCCVDRTHLRKKGRNEDTKDRKKRETKQVSQVVKLQANDAHKIIF